jgi:8-oxo-dGTP pyrophosphatase MutT (NUDIX family)
MPGHYVFPGGIVDAEDRDAVWEKHVLLDHAPWIQPRSSRSRNGILAYAIAAVRETFEEAGILLAREDGRGERDLSALFSKRHKGQLRSGWLREGVCSRGWKLALSSLHPWAHWITPTIRSKRFDTRFFLAIVPEEHPCIPDGRETVEGVWVDPKEALSSNLSGTMPLSPPTLVTLHELLERQGTGTLGKKLRSRCWGPSRCPRLVPAPEGLLLLLPWDPMYDDERSTAGASAGSVLDVGEPFSRMWLDAGVWRPVAA